MFLLLLIFLLLFLLVTVTKSNFEHFKTSYTWNVDDTYEFDVKNTTPIFSSILDESTLPDPNISIGKHIKQNRNKCGEPDLNNIVLDSENLESTVSNNNYCNYPVKRIEIGDCSVLHGDCNKWYQNQNKQYNICEIDPNPRVSSPPPGQKWCRASKKSCVPKIKEIISNNGNKSSIAIKTPTARCNYPIKRVSVADCSVVHGDCTQWYQTKGGENRICVVDSVPRSSPPPPGQFWCKPDSVVCLS